MTEDQILYFIILPISVIGFILIFRTIFNLTINRKNYFRKKCVPSRIFNPPPAPMPITCPGTEYPDPEYQDCENCVYHKNYIKLHENKERRKRKKKK